jgi:L-asparaginase
LDRQLYFYTDYTQVKQKMEKTVNSQENLTILLLGTGGTIAGLLKEGSQAKQGGAYTSAQLPVDALVPTSKHRIISEQIAQIDSKDMSFDVWEKLHIRILAAQNDPAIHAIVITHGTDTMEETAYFLHRTLVCSKPVILTGAMRPADAVGNDGPKNMAFALKQAKALRAGVWLAFAGKVFSGNNVRKAHPTRLDAFEAIADNFVADGSPVSFHPPIKRWPRVEVVMSYAGADGAIVDALIALRVDGIVVVGTGNCTVHDALQAKLDKAREADIAVSLTTRCVTGSTQNKNAIQARIDLILALLRR